MSNLEANRLELRGDLSELGRLPRWIKARAPEELSADTSFAVQLCLEEAVTNIIMYGCPKDDHLEIAIELERDGGTLGLALRIPARNSIRPNSRSDRWQSRS